MPRIAVKIGSVTAGAELHESDAPKSVASFWSMLPIDDRTIPTQWSGRAWRTEGDYAVMPEGTRVENVADRLQAGDIIYYPRLNKIGIAFGDARWLGPFCLSRDVTLIGHIDDNLDRFVEECMRIIYEGPLSVRLERIETG